MIIITPLIYFKIISMVLTLLVIICVLFKGKMEEVPFMASVEHFKFHVKFLVTSGVYIL